jgi:hypothetical protein
MLRYSDVDIKEHINFVVRNWKAKVKDDSVYVYIFNSPMCGDSFAFVMINQNPDAARRMADVVFSANTLDEMVMNDLDQEFIEMALDTMYEQTKPIKPMPAEPKPVKTKATKPQKEVNHE